MDLSPFLSQIIKWTLLVMAVTVVLGFLKSPSFKGIAGEWVVNVCAYLFFNKKDYHFIRNITLPAENGTTQIDHVIVSEFGVFVVETKNMRGWIFGSPEQTMWTQKIFKHTNKFQNPLRQNYKHLKTLESFLGIDEDKIHSVVVFIGDSTFKTPMPNNVVHGIGYIQHIKSYRRKLLTQDEVESIVRKIHSGRLPATSLTRSEHIRILKTSVRENSTSEVKCPQCGASMVLRTAKNGVYKGKKFWGCSRFPHCKGIVGIE